MIPEEIKKKINDDLEFGFANPNLSKELVDKYKSNLRHAMELGYSFSLAEIARLKEDVKELVEGLIAIKQNKLNFADLDLLIQKHKL